MFNQGTIIGRLTRDAELVKVTAGDKKVSRCSFTVAVNETKRNNEKIVTYFECTNWDKRAERIAPYLTKGRQVHVVGNIRLNTYVDKFNTSHARIQLANAEITFLDSNRQNDVPAEQIDDLEELNPEEME